MTGNTNRDENAESLNFCPHCGAKVLMVQNALMATETGVMGRVKKVDPVVLILHERGLDTVSLSSHEWTTFDAKDIKTAKFRPRTVTAKLPILPDESWEASGDVLQRFDNMLKTRHRSHRLKQGRFEELDWTYNILESEWRGVVLALHDGRELYFATEQAKGVFWHGAAYRLSKVISTMVKAS